MPKIMINLDKIFIFIPEENPNGFCDIDEEDYQHFISIQNEYFDFQSSFEECFRKQEGLSQ